MSTNTPSTKHTLWLWPTGLYPRRLIYYLRAKALPLSHLTTTLTISSLAVDLLAGDFVPRPGDEPRPSGASLPCLRIEPPNASPTYIYESTAIAEYFEELFAGQGRGGDMVGEGVVQRARTRDIVALINDAIVFSGFHAYNTSEQTLAFSGMKKEEMSEGNARFAVMRGSRMMGKIESLVKEDLEKGCRSLSGEGQGGTLADFAVMAVVDYMESQYGTSILDTFGGCGVLKRWCEEARGQSWFVGTEECAKLEKEGFEGLFVG
ncbi:hypothetical protein EJ04DRAFT_517543 [Polyplosphaeria fusca]|uniref:GST N-terminal domain-containing protein n=1 Tax=Polyplosphaeria fusca TaxID=682080 RepID=A0A9P4QLL0_9PLEO|nr:hypothetical protein EJ04DRAFT_517543 [Polyplosphaeria fusca]